MIGKIMDTSIQVNELLPNQVIVVNVAWNNVKSMFSSKYRGKNKKEDRSFPTSFVLDLPDVVYSMKESSEKTDAIESFAYNYLSKKFNCEVNKCQVFLPLSK